MSSVMIILDILIVLGLVVSAVMAVHFEKLLNLRFAQVKAH